MDCMFGGWDENVPGCLDGAAQEFAKRKEGEDKSQATESWNKGAVQGKGLGRAASAGLAHWPSFLSIQSSLAENPPSTTAPSQGPWNLRYSSELDQSAPPMVRLSLDLPRRIIHSLNKHL